MGLAFAPSALYPYYVHHARVWGISALDDQSIAGLIMAVEQSIVMGIALVVLFVRALDGVRARAAAPRALRTERPERRAPQRARAQALRGCRGGRRSRRSGSTPAAISVPGKTMLSRSCAPSPMLAPSPSTTGPIRRTPAPIAHVAPDPRRALDLGVLAQRAAAGDGHARARPPRPRSRRRSSPRSASKVPWRSSPSEPTSFQYSRTSWMWNGHVVLEQRREDVLRPVDERALGEVVEDLRARTRRCRSCRGPRAPPRAPASPGSR